ncbi:MAG: bifunctional phosphoribosylaminoimidazolecarboxamide formyltransferase/IMP cyclohydrolase, partial [Pseudomonadota bacterium]
MSIVSKKIPAPDRVKIKRALLSVSDKTGLVELARALADLGIELVSTGGTRRAISDAGIKVVDVSDVTGFPEIMDGRVKTLHPKVHGGLLAIRDDEDHRAAMSTHGIEGFDLVVINLYPFAEVLASDADAATMIENIDIGGPAMVRASAKNHAYVTIVTDPSDYDELLAELSADAGATRLDTRRKLAGKAFQRTASYDAMVSNWMVNQFSADGFDQFDALGGSKAALLRYGENPHQHASLYLTGEKRPGAATAKVLQGKALSYNNLNDTDAAFELVSEFDAGQPAVAIIKHANPCGVAVGKTFAEAYQLAYDCDRTSAFGGIVAVNGQLDAETASLMTQIFTEVIIAPSVTDEAAEIIAAKKNLRLLVTGGLADPKTLRTLVRPIAGGYLKQSSDGLTEDDMDLRSVTKRQPTDAEMVDLRFAFRVA